MATSKISDLKPGTWFKFLGSKDKCKYFGESSVKVGTVEKVYLFMRENGQGYFIQNGNKAVWEITDYNYGKGLVKYFPNNLKT